MNTDPIADMLTRIRNAYMARKLDVQVPYSRVKEGIAQVLLKYEYLDQVGVDGEGVNKQLNISLAYDVEGEPKLKKIERVSRPSLREYVKSKDIKYVRGGYGIMIVSTSKGIMAGQEAKKMQLGGEIIAIAY